MRRPSAITLCAAILLLVLLSSSLPSSAAQCANGEVSCDVCDHQSRGNDISGLPRINARGHFLTPNLAAYSWYTCDAFGHNCHSFLSNPQYSHWLNPMPDDAHPINYVQSVAAYVLFGVACVLVSLCVGFGLCCCRYWYDRDVGGLCGGVHPQRRLRWVGVVIDPVDKRWKYTWKERWFARALMVTFVVLLWTWVGLGYFNGTATLPAAAKSTVASPAGVATTLQSTQQPIVDLLQAMSSQTLVHAVENVSTLLTDVVSLPDMVAQMQCISGPVHALPSVSGVNALLANVTGVAGLISTAQSQMDTAIASNLLTLSLPLKQAVANLTLYSAASPTTAVKSVVANLTSFLNYTGNIQVESNNIAPKLTTFTTLAPNATTLTTLANAPNASLARLIPDTANSYPISNSTERQLLLYRWNNFTATLAGLPNLSTVSSAIQRYNADVALAAAQLNSALLAINRTMTAATVWDRYMQAINTTLTAYPATVAAFNLAPELALVTQLNTSVLALLAGQQTQLVSQVGQLSNLSSVLPCMAALLPLVDVINSQVMTLEGNISAVITTYAQQLNGTLPTIVATLTNFSSQLTSITSGSGSLFNFSSVLTALSNASTAIAGMSSQLNLTNFNSLSTLHQSIMQQLNLSADYITLSVLSTVLASATIPTSLTTALTAYDTYYQSLVTNFTSFSSNLTLWNGALFAGYKKCVLSTNTACVYNRQCNVLPGDRCVLDYDQVALLEQQVATYYSHYPSFTDMNGNATTVTVVNATLGNDGVKPLQLQLNATAAVLAGESGPISSAATDLNAIVYRLSNYSTASIDAQFASLSTTVNTTLNFSSTVAAVNTFNSTLQTIQSNLPAFDSTLQLLTTFNSFLFTDYPHKFSPQLTNFTTPPTTSPISAVANLTLQLAAVVNAMLGELDGVQAIADSVGSYDFVNRSVNVRSYLDMIYSSEYSMYGAIYYLGSIVSQFYDAITVLNPNNLVSLESISTTTTNTSASAIAYDPANWASFDTFDSRANRVNAFADGSSYPSSTTLCLTDNCLHNTIDYYTQTGLQTLTAGVVPVPVTALHLNGLLFLIPAVIGLLGFAALMAWRKWGVANWLATLTVILLCVFLPLMFVFALVLFPVLVVQADVCYGGLNLGYNMLVQQRDTICTMIGGQGPADNCVYTLDGFDIILNIPALYEDVLGGQCDSSVTDNAVLAMFNSIRDSASLWPDAKVTDAIANFNNNTGGLTIQPRLASVLHSAAAETSAHLQDFITELSGQLSCDALHASFANVKSAFCCSVTSSLYWFAGSWFLIGLTCLLCGVPAAVCGRKRFAAEIPDSELKTIDRYFSKDRVLREEGYLKKGRGGSVEKDGHGGPRRRGSKGGSVAPMEDEGNAIEMAYLKAEREKAEVDAALKAIEAAERAERERNAAGEPGEGADGGLAVRALGARRDSGGERIDVIVASPSGSHEPSQNWQDAADRDDRRGVNAMLGGNAQRKRPSALQHPMGINISRTSLTPSPNPNSANDYLNSAPALTPSPFPVNPLPYTDDADDDGKLPPGTSAPTPLAILVHRPSAPGGGGGGGVFSYGEESDGEGEEEAEDVESYARKWPSLSGREEEERKAMEQSSRQGQGPLSQQRTPSLSVAASAVTPVSPMRAIRPSVEGVRDTGEDSLDAESTSEEDESSEDDDDEVGNHMPTFR